MASALASPAAALTLPGLAAAVQAAGAGSFARPGDGADTGVFVLRRSCQCLRPGCPACAACSCPPQAFTIVMDGAEITHLRWVAVLKQRLAAAPGREAVVRASMEAMISHVPSCEFCRSDIGAAVTGAPGAHAPQFWHRPSGVAAWWDWDAPEPWQANASPAAVAAAVADAAASLA